MKDKRTLAIGGLAAAGGGVFLLRRRMAGGKWGGRVVASDGSDGGTNAGRQDRWHAVTVNLPPEEASSGGRLPGPLADLGDGVEVRIRPAPANKGTEIAARVRGPVPSGLGGAAARARGDDPRQSLPKALREAKQQLETGEVLSPNTRPSTKPTPGGRLLGAVPGRSWEEGRL
jgi:hypothetical protein